MAKYPEWAKYQQEYRKAHPDKVKQWRLTDYAKRKLKRQAQRLAKGVQGK